MSSSSAVTQVGQALAAAERAILSPIVEGELAIRAAEIRDALGTLKTAWSMLPAGSAELPQPNTPGEAVAEDALLENVRLGVQLDELTTAAEALSRRAERVEPDEKRLTEEVDALTGQAREFFIDARRHLQPGESRQASAGSGQSCS